jgi:hypothetical protein
MIMSTIEPTEINFDAINLQRQKDDSVYMDARWYTKGKGFGQFMVFCGRGKTEIDTETLGGPDVYSALISYVRDKIQTAKFREKLDNETWYHVGDTRYRKSAYYEPPNVPVESNDVVDGEINTLFEELVSRVNVADPATIIWR